MTTSILAATSRLSSTASARPAAPRIRPGDAGSEGKDHPRRGGAAGLACGQPGTAHGRGTESEGRVLPQWCDQQHLRYIVMVTTKDHSRRLRRVLDRDMKGHPTQVRVQATRYSSFDPDRWWETRGGVRTEIFELEKLLLDVVPHPLSF